MGRKEDIRNKIINGAWEINKKGENTFINCGNICVAQVNEFVAEEIVENHNDKLKKGAIHV
mgnify:CR=1 FL=1